MPLQKQAVPIPLGVGLDTKTDPKQVQPGKLSVLENAVFTKIGQLTKRGGLSSFGRTISGTSSTITQARDISAFKSELNLIDGASLYTYAPSTNTWISKAALSGATASSSSVIRNTYEQSVPDVAIGSGLILYAWEDSSGGVRASVYDQVSKQPILANVLISSLGSRPKCSANSGYLYVHYMETASTAFKCRRFNPGSPTAFESAVTLASDANSANPYFDISPIGNNFVFAYRTTAALKVGYIRQDGNVGGLLDGFPVPLSFSEVPTNCISLIAYSNSDVVNDGIYVAWHNSTNGTRIAKFGLGLTTAPTPVTLDPSTTTVRSIGLVQESPSVIRAYYGVDAAQTYNRFIKQNTLTSGAAGTASVFLRSVGLHSKPWRYNSKTYVVISHESTLQSSYFTVNASGIIVNRISYQNGGGNSAKQSALANAAVNSATAYIIPTQVKGPLRSESGTVFTVKGLQATAIDFDDSKIFENKTLGNNSHISSGLLLGYDGVNVNELGFNLYPENVSASIDNTSGNLVAGDRTYYVIYEWTDQQGQIHRSAPSIGLFTTTTGGTSKITLTIPTLRLTQKANVSIAVYRTIAAGTTAYRVTSISSPTLNSTTTDTVTYLDNTADSSITSNELLYTTGGVLENIPPPSAASITAYNNRLVLTGLEDANEIWYSKTYVPGEGVAFNDAFKLRVDQGDGGVNVSGVIDDKIIFFKRSQIFYTQGFGPLDTGFQNDLQDPVLITSDCGCTEPKSVVRTPLGLMFKSAKGFYLLNRSLDLKYIGAPVESFNTLTVTSAVLVDKKNQIRFTHSDGVCLVYDYFFDQWSSFTNYAAISATSWNGSYILARSNGEVNQESETSFLDNGSAVSMRAVTPWLSIAGIQGYQRIYEGIFLGENKSSHIYQVRIGYNFEEHWRESLKVDTATVLGSNYYGQDAYYGASTYYGGVLDPVHQFKVKPAIQKCQAIRFEISDLNPTQIDGGGFSLSGLTLIVGAKAGTNKVGATKVMT
jgi:hypothetical protein